MGHDQTNDCEELAQKVKLRREAKKAGIGVTGEPEEEISEEVAMRVEAVVAKKHLANHVIDEVEPELQ